EVAQAMTPGSHGGTMIGNPLVSAAGRAYCKILFEEGLADQAAAMGAKTVEILKTWIDEVPCVEEVRGLGLMIGIRLNQSGADVAVECEKNGLLLNCTAGNVIRLLPPLNVTQEEVDQALRILREALENLE
ncbi:MAG: aminotransferase class III-fold pyridoxal phosphate-dependent enzyme, partial [Candidatus Sumerlaeota bacterium]